MSMFFCVHLFSQNASQTQATFSQPPRRFWPSFPQPVSEREASIHSHSSGTSTLPLLHFLSREGGSKPNNPPPPPRAQPSSACLPACSQQLLQRLPASRRLRLHRRIKDRWITANEPARTISTGAFPGLNRAQPAGLACHSRGGHRGCWLCVSVPLIALVIGSPRSWEP